MAPTLTAHRKRMIRKNDELARGTVADRLLIRKDCSEVMAADYRATRKGDLRKRNRRRLVIP